MLSNSPVLNFPFEQRLEASTAAGHEQDFGGAGLAVYATHAQGAKGRLIFEKDCPQRSPFARDRDRILHSTAFRRLAHKTQVFICHEGDHYRTRLTHSLEVAQIARSLARSLRLDEDLSEAIALAHDLGHTPFGHAGERALDRAMQGFGGYDHNSQTLRLLTRLERRYAAFDGLNLTWETLEGLIKHNGPFVDHAGKPLCGNREALSPELRGYEARYNFGLHRQAGPEAQVAAIADDIAYNNHDIDDGLRAGLFTLDDLKKVSFLGEMIAQIRSEYGDLDEVRLVFELNRRLMTHMIKDVMAESRARLDALSPASAEDIRAAADAVIGFSGGFLKDLDELRRFLKRHVYHHDKVMRVMGRAERVVEDLVQHYLRHPEDLPAEWRCNLVSINISECAERIRDFVSGMTDRYALDMHCAKFDVTPKLR